MRRSKEACSSSSKSGFRPHSGCSCDMYSSAAAAVVVRLVRVVGVVGVVGDKEVSSPGVSGIQERRVCDFLNLYW